MQDRRRPAAFGCEGFVHAVKGNGIVKIGRQKINDVALGQNQGRFCIVEYKSDALLGILRGYRNVGGPAFKNADQGNDEIFVAVHANAHGFARIYPLFSQP